MKLKILLVTFTVLICSCNSFSQRNDTQAAIYNVGFGSIFSGIGAVINKKQDEKWHKVLIKGLWQGALGGYVVFESKRVLSLQPEHQKWTYAWGAKLLNAAGNSMKENASLNKDFYEQWNMNIGFMRLEFNAKNVTFQPKIMPVSFYWAMHGVATSKFEFSKSIENGEMIFSTNNTEVLHNYVGITHANTVILQGDMLNNYNLITHEIIHTYQYNDFAVFNPYIQKPVDYFSKKSGIFKTINKWVYFDLNAYLFTLVYSSENNNRDCYYDNFFEHEAGYYSNTITCE